MTTFSRSDLNVLSQGTRCAAWLYRPPTSGPHPAVVMAHGFSAVREQRLDASAEVFAQAGFVVLLFDYRHFGSSDGEPRQLLNVDLQLQDWEAAIATVRTLPDVDPKRIALWGTSLSGGHVQTLAARDHSIAAVIAQTPFCDGSKPPKGIPRWDTLRLVGASLRDFAHSRLGLPPHYVAAIGTPGVTLGAISSPDATDGMAALNPPNSTWRNRVAARALLATGSYRPAKHAEAIACPIFYCIGERDVLIAPDMVRSVAARAPRSEVKGYDSGHFNIYVDPVWSVAVADQTAFLLRHLRP